MYIFDSTTCSGDASTQTVSSDTCTYISAADDDGNNFVQQGPYLSYRGVGLPEHYNANNDIAGFVVGRFFGAVLLAGLAYYYYAGRGEYYSSRALLPRSR